MAFGGRWRGKDGLIKPGWLRVNREKQDPLLRRIEDELVGRVLEFPVTVSGKLVSDWDGEMVTVPELLARLGHRQMNYSVPEPVNSNLRGWVCFNGHFTRYVVRPPREKCTKCLKEGLTVYWKFKIIRGILYYIDGKLVRFQPTMEWEIRNWELPVVKHIEEGAPAIEVKRWEELATGKVELVAGGSLKDVPDEDIIWEDD